MNHSLPCAASPKVAARLRKAVVPNSPASVTTSGRRMLRALVRAGNSANAPVPKRVGVGKEKVVRLIFATLLGENDVRVKFNRAGAGRYVAQRKPTGLKNSSPRS